MNRPSSAGIRALLPLAAALFLTVAAVPAQAAKVQHGVQLVHNEPKIAEPEAITRMQQAHVDLIRTTFDWLYAEPTEDGGFDFTQLDDFMKAASTGRRIQVLPALVSSPNWISPKQPGDPPLGTAELNRWDAYVRALIARYGDNGTFFTDTPGVTYNPIRDWQVWNEPNLKSFWTNQHPNAKEYEPFLAHTSKVIRAADPQANVVLAGMPEREDAPRSMADFLQQLYQVKGFSRSIDVVAMHPFAEDEKGIIGGISRIRDILDANGDEDLPIYITEFGFSSTGSSGPPSPFTQSASGQAKLLTKSFKAIDKNARRFSVQKAVWYSFRDLDELPANNPALNSWQTYTGLFTFNGQPKKSWSAYAKYHRGNAGSGPIP